MSRPSLLVVTLLVSTSLALPRTTSVITTLAGGGPDRIAALSSDLYYPVAAVADSSGNIFIAAPLVARVFKVDAAGRLTVAAGTGSAGNTGDGGPARAARLSYPAGLAVDGAGNLFIADRSNQSVRRVDALSGVITKVAGNGATGFSGDGGPALLASFAFSTYELSALGLAVGPSGALYISDTQNYRVRRVDPVTGIITTVAGRGQCFTLDDGGPATSACLSEPHGVALDAVGNLFIATHERVRKVDAVTGIITTVAGGGSMSGDGVPATNVYLDDPYGVAVHPNGDLYLAVPDSDPAAGGIFRPIRRVSAATGLITYVAGNGSLGFSGDGGPATSARLTLPFGVALDRDGNVLIPDGYNIRIRRVDTTSGIITTIAGGGPPMGDGSPAVSATLWGPDGLAAEPGGGILIADSSANRIRRVDGATRIITTVAGSGQPGSTGDGGPALAAKLRSPEGVARDAAGNLHIADTANNKIRRVDAVTGVITSEAGTGAAGFSGDGQTATSGRLNAPSDVLADAAGNIFISDTLNHRVRRVDNQNGMISTVAGGGACPGPGDGGLAVNACLDSPEGIALDEPNGILYIADTLHHRIRAVQIGSGLIDTVAGVGVAGFSGDGGLATVAQLNAPEELALDAAGNLFIADRLSNRVRRIDAATREITTVAGNGIFGLSGDTGPATSAAVRSPTGVEVDGSGRIYISTSARARLVTDQAAPAGSLAESGSPGNRLLELSVMQGGDLFLSWGDSCVGSDTDFEIYEGSLGDFTSHSPRVCSTGGATAMTLTPPPGDVYYLVAPRNILREGSLGRRSAGVETPPGAMACLPQTIGICQ